MDFFYRTLQDGRCEVVCTRCFLTIGTAAEAEAIWALEDNHSCTGAAFAMPSAQRTSSLADLPVPVPTRQVAPHKAFTRKASGLRTALLALCATIALYALPTLFEFAAMRRWNPWLAVMLPGDLAGCLCLILVFRRVRTGITLYLLLTFLEGTLYALHILPLSSIVWIVDLIPTLLVIQMLWRSPADNRPRISYS